MWPELVSWLVIICSCKRTSVHSAHEGTGLADHATGGAARLDHVKARADRGELWDITGSSQSSASHAGQAESDQAGPHVSALFCDEGLWWELQLVSGSFGQANES